MTAPPPPAPVLHGTATTPPTTQVSFDSFVPLAHGGDHGRFTVASAAATDPGRTS